MTAVASQPGTRRLRACEVAAMLFDLAAPAEGHCLSVRSLAPDPDDDRRATFRVTMDGAEFVVTVEEES